MTKKFPEKFRATVEVSDEAIRGLLCCAFEGGSNYWYDIVEVKCPAELGMKDYAEGGKGQDGGSYWHWSQLVPLQDGGRLSIVSREGDEINGKKLWHLDRAAIQYGLQVMSEKYPQAFADFVAEREDASTGDVFLQCCLFGEVVYG